MEFIKITAMLNIKEEEEEKEREKRRNRRRAATAKVETFSFKGPLTIINANSKTLPITYPLT